MKVKVAYTVDFDDVPEIITELLQDCKNTIQTEISKLKFTPHNYEKMLQNLSSVRANLVQLDSSLQDIEHLVTGWAAVLEPPVEPEPEAGEDNEES